MMPYSVRVRDYLERDQLDRVALLSPYCPTLYRRKAPGGMTSACMEET